MPFLFLDSPCEKVCLKFERLLGYHLPWSSRVTWITICFVSVSPASCNPSLFEMYKLECKVLLNQTMLTWLQLRAIKNFCLENVNCLLVSSASNFSTRRKVSHNLLKENGKITIYTPSCNSKPIKHWLIFAINTFF